MTPGLAHAAIAAALTALVGVPAALLLRVDAIAALLTGGVLGLALGAVFAIGVYAGRERRQSEEWWGSNRIPPWLWRPRAWRDMGWAALAAVGVVVLAWVAHVAFWAA